MDKIVRQKVDDFFSKYPSKFYEKKQILVYAGEEPQGIYHIISGQVRQFDINKKGNEQVVNVFKPPAFFPMDWAITGKPNRYFFDAYTPVEVKIAPASDTIKFLKANNDVLFDLLNRLYTGVHGMQQRMALLMGGDVTNRVLLEIILESRRFGEIKPDGSCVLEMHEDELANRSGLTRETVSRQLQLLKKRGLLEVSHKSLKIKNLDALATELEY